MYRAHKSLTPPSSGHHSDTCSISPSRPSPGGTRHGGSSSRNPLTAMMHSASRHLDSIRQLVIPRRRRSRRHFDHNANNLAVHGDPQYPQEMRYVYGGPVGEEDEDVAGKGQHAVLGGRRSRTRTCPVGEDALRPRRCSFPEVFLTVPENSLPGTRVGSAVSSHSASVINEVAAAACEIPTDFFFFSILLFPSSPHGA